MLLKWWNHQVVMTCDTTMRFKSFLLELLVLYAIGEVGEGEPEAYDLFRHVLRLIVGWRHLRVTWSWGNLFDSGELRIRNQCPMVLDPENPTNNVARTMQKWAEGADIAERTLHVLSSPPGTQAGILVARPWKAIPSEEDDDELSPQPRRPPWEGFEDFITEDNCEMFGLNDYVFEKYGGMMGFSSWYGEEL